MLNEMRYGQLSPGTIDAFRRLSRDVDYRDDIAPTELYALRDQVSAANSWRLSQLKTEARTFRALDQAGYDADGKPISEERKRQLLNKLVCQADVTLKVGAQVMLIKVRRLTQLVPHAVLTRHDCQNLIQGELVNGSVGVVTRFATLAELGKEEKEGKHVDGLFQADGTTAKSRSMPPDQSYPVVKFIGGRERVITPADFEITSPDNKMEARRIQVPLILAWALSVHKSQGQTLERVKVDLGRTFEKGQAYVAISRATRLEQLQILNFDPGKYVFGPPLFPPLREPRLTGFIVWSAELWHTPGCWNGMAKQADQPNTTTLTTLTTRTRSSQCSLIMMATDTSDTLQGTIIITVVDTVY